MAHGQDEERARSAAEELALLREETQGARAELAQVRAEVTEAEDRLEDLHTANAAVADCEDRLREVSRMTGFDFLTDLPTRALMLSTISAKSTTTTATPRAMRRFASPLGAWPHRSARPTR